MSMFVGEGDLGSLELTPGAGYGMPVFAVDVELWVQMLPLGMRELLALGPVDGGEEHARPCCTVCRVSTLMDERGQMNAGLDFLHGWHKGGGGDHKAVASYLRCLHIYLTAGWDGVHRGVDVCLGCERCGAFYPLDSMGEGELCCGVEPLKVEFARDAEQTLVWAAP